MEEFVFNVQRFSTRDGPGIRTTVFFQGCNLNCAWCHNPEGIPMWPTLQYFEDRCISCSKCTTVCPNNAHSMVDGKHVFDRSRCRYCGLCTRYCPQDALKANATAYTPEALAALLLRDAAYYRNSGGGVTVSGGEPLLRTPFVKALFTLLKAEQVHTAVDSAANVPYSSIEEVLPMTDLFLIDIKSIDPVIHKGYTGVDNRRILENIRLLNASGAAMEIRMPLIGGVNDAPELAEQTAEFLNTLQAPPPVRLLPYHNYGLYKAQSVDQAMQEYEPPEELDVFADILSERHIVVRRQTT